MNTFVRKGALKPVSSNSIKVSELKAEDVVVIGRFDSIEEVTNPKDGKKFEVLHFTDLEGREVKVNSVAALKAFFPADRAGIKVEVIFLGKHKVKTAKGIVDKNEFSISEIEADIPE